MTQVLVLDHDNDVRASLSYLLHDEGYVVLEADDGPDLVRLLDAATERLIVLFDLGLPTEHEKLLLATLASHPELAARHAYICMSTSSLLSAEMHAMLARLDVPMLPKPFEVDELLGAVQRAASLTPTTLHADAHTERREY
jgi:CheY-like chemotaxis protein